MDFEDEHDEENMASLKVIRSDVKRTFQKTEIFKNKVIMNLLVRLLFVWNMRHPETGYVQGINDIAAQFLIIFLVEEFPEVNENVLKFP